MIISLSTWICLLSWSFWMSSLVRSFRFLSSRAANASLIREPNQYFECVLSLTILCCIRNSSPPSSMSRYSSYSFLKLLKAKTSTLLVRILRTKTYRLEQCWRRWVCFFLIFSSCSVVKVSRMSTDKGLSSSCNDESGLRLLRAFLTQVLAG